MSKKGKGKKTSSADDSADFNTTTRAPVVVYDYVADNPPELLLCTVCNEPLRTAMVTTCGHNICLECTVGLRDCPFCKAVLRNTDGDSGPPHLVKVPLLHATCLRDTRCCGAGRTPFGCRGLERP